MSSYELYEAQERLKKREENYNIIPNEINKQLVDYTKNEIKELTQKRLDNPDNPDKYVNEIKIGWKGISFVGIIVILILALIYYCSFYLAFDTFVNNKKDKTNYEKLNMIEKHKILSKENPGYLALGPAFSIIIISCFALGLYTIATDDKKIQKLK
jgi:hypothetical protein